MKIVPDEAEADGFGGSKVEADNKVWPELHRNPKGWCQFFSSLCRSSIPNFWYALSLSLRAEKNWLSALPAGKSIADSEFMRAGFSSRLILYLAAALASTLALPDALIAQPPTDTFRWVDFHSSDDQSIIAWVTRSMQVEKWTSIREIGVLYDAALVVTANRPTPQSPPGADTFTIWNASLTSHVIAPLLTGVNPRWFDWEHFVDGGTGELTLLYENCRECAASTFFTAFHYDIAHHMWTARWLRGGQGVLVWNATPPSSPGISWTQVSAVMSGADGRALLATWNHFEYGKEKPPADTIFRYDVDPTTGMDRTVDLTHEDAAAMKLRLCRAQDTVQGLARGQDSALCAQMLNDQPQRKPVTTPPANNRGQSAPPASHPKH